MHVTGDRFRIERRRIKCVGENSSRSIKWITIAMRPGSEESGDRFLPEGFVLGENETCTILFHSENARAISDSAESVGSLALVSWKA